MKDFNPVIETLKNKGFTEEKKSAWPFIPCWRFIKGFFVVSLWFNGEITSVKYEEKEVNEVDSE